MSYLNKVENQRDQNRLVELRRKLKKAAARRAGLMYLQHRAQEQSVNLALRTRAVNT